MRKLYYLTIAFLLISLVSGCSNKSSDSKKNDYKAANNTLSEQSSADMPTTNTPIAVTPSEVNSQNKSQSSYSSLSMMNETTGWIVKDNKLLRTVDGGNSWRDISPYNDGSAMAGKCFYDGNTAWVSRGTEIYHTIDGGSHWGKTILNIKEKWELCIYQIDFLNQMDGYALVVSDAAMGKMSKSIYKTNDGGENWQRIGDITNKIYSYPLSMKFKNANEGLITSTSRGENDIFTFKTTDGGTTWSKENMEMLDAYRAGYYNIEVYKAGYYTNSYQPAFFTNSQDGVVPVEYVALGQWKRFVIPYITNDDGSTWSHMYDLNTNNTFECYDFYNKNQWWAINRTDNILYKTNDSGEYWNKVSESSYFKDIESINFVSEKVGWAMGSNIFIKTIDAGKTWSKAD